MNKVKLLSKALLVFLPLILILGVIPFTPLSPFTGQKVAAADVEEFVFEVTVPAGGTFRIPVSGRLNNINNSYNWNIDWGDGNTQTASGTGSTTSAGIPHTYTTAGIYIITITPNASTDAWLKAFGFYDGTSGANVQTNKEMVTKIVSPLTPLMTRTQTQLNAGTAPTNEWYYAFYQCINLTMGPDFTFSASWNDITRVGDSFVRNLFSGCSGDAFTMNSVFNFPQGITTVGDNFAQLMFSSCRGASFTMNSVFNLPQDIATVGNRFASQMFQECRGAAFTMNSVFNLPQSITDFVGDSFASSMFFRCYGSAFTMNSIFNFPQGITTVGDYFAYCIFRECYGSAFTMSSVFSLPQGITTVGNSFASSMFYQCYGSAFTMNSVFNLPQG
ncbi:MAG: leucine-rich repeat domain-containing protein, partial [Dehalococcoidia bacterium]|nr:leucine-rich repeat domain-containing protein [Dehalococcoidia bacterium]